MKLDFLIPGSPNDAFFSQIAFFRLALDGLGGAYRQARLVAVFGDDTIAPIPSRWSPYLERVEIEWADPADFKRRGYLAQGDRRFDLFRAEADLVVLCDADTAVMRAWPDLAKSLSATPALAGVIAHYHFPWENSTGQPEHDWEKLAEALLGHEMPLNHRYSLQDPVRANSCPFYINYGFFAGPPALMSRFSHAYRAMVPRVHGIVANHFSCQVAVAITIAELGLPTRALPMRYNFPNDSKADALYPQELKQIVVQHYLRTNQFDRQHIFASNAEFERFLELDLEGSNRHFQSFVRKLTNGRYPFTIGRPARNFRWLRVRLQDIVWRR
jgi:hypothetical protein